MQLPNCADAFVQPEKLSKYLLSQTHKVGKSKAKFFRDLGYDETTLELLASQLLEIAQREPVIEVKETVHGLKYVIVGAVTSPLKQPVTILTVWIIDKGKTAPRFVTAHPYR